MTIPAFDMKVIFEALPNPLFVLDEKNAIILANGACEDFFQTSVAVLLKHNLSDLVSFGSPVHEAIDKVRAEGGVVNEYSVAIGTPRMGGERTIDLQTTGIVDRAGLVLVMLLRRSMAQKFDLQLSHRGAARSVSSMAAMLAHEIKNPLSGIRGAAQLLEPNLDEADQSLARLICDETERIRNLVDQMEVFSDERPLEKKPVNIHVVLDRVKQLVAFGNSEGVVLREDYDPSLPAVSGNHDQLVQVFLNLAKNAVEAIGQAGGEVHFSTAFRPGMKLSVPGSAQRISLPLEVCVHDNGPGVSEDIRAHIFDPFITSKTQGKGLGLALVAKIVRDHGGVVECIDRDLGTTFRVLLPLQKHTEE
jgi:two-component system, NtrC family, nitrogen regulation sensor histidine kinase GlnL